MGHEEPMLTNSDSCKRNYFLCQQFPTFWMWYPCPNVLGIATHSDVAQCFWVSEAYNDFSTHLIQCSIFYSVWVLLRNQQGSHKGLQLFPIMNPEQVAFQHIQLLHGGYIPAQFDQCLFLHYSL